MAMDRNRLIGKGGGLPWRIPADMRHFRERTMGCPMIVGRRTFAQDIGRPLPGREIIVVTRDPEWHFDGVYPAPDLGAAWCTAAALMPHAPEACVIGGAALCRIAIDQIKILYLTVIDAEFEGDTWFDSFEWQGWQVLHERKLSPGEDTDWPLSFFTLERKQ